MKRFAKSGIVIVTILLFTLLFAGCYWTPEQREGGVTLEIDSRDIGASQAGNYEGFFFGWVVADDLMKGGEAEADRAFSEVEAAIEEAFIEAQSTSDISDFVVDVALPSLQLQASFFTGNSGSNTFRGLQANREYLVVVEAYSYSTETDGVGFTTVEIEAGETKTVSLDIGNNWAAFEDFLLNRYGIPPEGVAVNIVPVYTGSFTQVPGSLYYDFVDVDAIGTALVMEDYVDSGGGDTYASNSLGLGAALDGTTLVDKTGASIPSPFSGTRSELPPDYAIEGVLPGMRVQIVVTDNWDRNYNYPGTPPYGAGVIGISDPFTVGAELPSVFLYEWRTC
jgi:hypothetical protein